jgi:hypothetical protein
MKRIPTCWEDCEDCGTELFSCTSSNPKRRVFSMCMHGGQEKHRCFEVDAICENVKRKAAAPALKPATPGWADY